MSSLLEQDKEFLQALLEANRTMINLSMQIIDSDRLCVAASGAESVKNCIGKYSRPDGAIARHYLKGVRRVTISHPGESENCIGCADYKSCPRSLYNVAVFAQIIVDGEIIGVLGAMANDKESNDLILKKEKAVYNWMCKNLEMAETSQVNIPVSSSQIDEPYGVLKTGTGVPVGFATTFRMFMEMLEIPCKVVHDTAFTNAWNMVQLDDENWYHVDVGSDITYGNFENFNMNENVASYKHTWDTEFFPAAAGTKYCYALMKAGEVKDLYNIPTRIKKAYDKKRKCIFLKFKTSSGKDLEVVDELVSRTADYLGGNLSQNADTTENAEAGGRGVADAVCIKMEDYYMLGVFFADGSQKNAGLTEKDFNKISKAVEKAFPAVG